MNRLMRVNLCDKCITYEEIPPEYQLLGGRALTSRIISDEVPPDCEVFDKSNKLVFAPGLLGGVSASSVHRLSVGGKSPLTGGIKESNSGGNVALKMAKLDIKALIIEGKAKMGELVVLKIDNDEAMLEDAEEARGLKATPAAKWLRKRYGDKVAFSLVGPAGEEGLLASAIINSDLDGYPARYSARGGLGAVMGDKGLKAIVIDDKGTRMVQPARKQEFKTAVKQYTQLIRTTPQTNELYPKYGTTAMVDVTNEYGGMPTKNFSTGRFEDAHKINGTALRDLILERGGEPAHPCVPGCIIKSSNVFICKDGKTSLRSFEYETIVICGSNCGIGNLDDIAELNIMINEYGLDSIEIGGSIGIAMEAGLASFGDVDAAKQMVQEIESDTVLGKVLGHGAAVTGKILGVKRVPVVKNQMMAAYEPRIIKGHGITYATSPMGADHTAGMTIREGVDPNDVQGTIEASKSMQLFATLYDSLGLCLFVHMAIKNRLDVVKDMVNAHLDKKLTVNELMDIARDTLKREVLFNRKAGLGKITDRLPAIFTNEVLPSSGTVFDINQESLDGITEW